MYTFLKEFYPNIYFLLYAFKILMQNILILMEKKIFLYTDV